jgi:hypothetical protein
MSKRETKEIDVSKYITKTELPAPKRRREREPIYENIIKKIQDMPDGAYLIQIPKKDNPKEMRTMKSLYPTFDRYIRSIDNLSLAVRSGKLYIVRGKKPLRKPHKKKIKKPE